MDFQVVVEVTMLVLVEMTTQEVEGDYYLKIVQHIRAISSPFGKIKTIRLDRSVSYKPDLTRPYVPTKSKPQVLEGDLLFVGRRNPATIEEKIIQAIVGDYDVDEPLDEM